MQIRFILGPAGSGKTHRCLAGIRAALRAAPDGPPLILLAPKQATFQLERQLLAGRELPGYTRLRIVSFERLAAFVFEQLGLPEPDLLTENGRVMVLRALLEQKRQELNLYRASARLPGFARQLSGLLRELQQHHLAPPRLESLAERVGETNRLDARLRDLALIFRAYNGWLEEHELEDADRLLDQAAAAMKKNTHCSPSPAKPLEIGGLWLDGFAQMTPQERRLLVAMAPVTGTMTLAFCLDREPGETPPWHSAWAPVGETFLRCRDDLRVLPGADVWVEILGRDRQPNRFQTSVELRHLEANWGLPIPFVENTAAGSCAQEAVLPSASGGFSQGIRIVACANPEAESEWAAREIRRYVREDSGRFRDVAVLLRSLDGHHDAIRRVFARYDIPYFLDRRESVAHHPLAELTRYALRLATFGWEHDDWFGALKTGLVPASDLQLDRLENEALVRGWRGRAFWTQPIHGAESFEPLRQRLVPPFDQFTNSLASTERRPDGVQLSGALRQLWETLKVTRTLETWSSSAAMLPGVPNPALHETVWQQILEWLHNIELAFAGERIALDQWLPIVEAGLGTLSVGVVPPALDQVLVGAVDRSRNPELKVTVVLGLNEGLFPAPPPPPTLLSRTDRDTLAAMDASLGPDHWQQTGLERYYAYIALTRARDRLVLTYARRDSDGRELNPSGLIHDVRRLFPAVQIEEWIANPIEVKYWTELVTPLLDRPPGLGEEPSGAGSRGVEAPGTEDCGGVVPDGMPDIGEAFAAWRQLADPQVEEALTPALVEAIYGTELRTSVSALEDFASCPFKFFAARGLRAEERSEFEVDAREKGSLQHEILKEFHLEIARSGKRWRDVGTEEARAIVRAAGEKWMAEFRDGLFLSAPGRRFAARTLIERLEQLMETLCTWARHYQFDPAAVETSFGLKESRLPAWRIELDDRHALLLRGRVDRVDVCRLGDTGEALGVVVDYKSSARELDRILLEHGIELQLLAYLGALSQFEGLEEELGVARLIPAGAFYVALKGGARSVGNRDEEREAREASGKAGCQHRGRFDGGYLAQFDGSGAAKGEQFRYAKKKDGTFASRGNEALSTAEFQSLVAQVKEFLRRHGREIYAGTVRTSPYRLKHRTACDYCDYRPVCRFDPWTQPFRVLRAAAESEGAGGP